MVEEYIPASERPKASVLSVVLSIGATFTLIVAVAGAWESKIESTRTAGRIEETRIRVAGEVEKIKILKGAYDDSKK